MAWHQFVPVLILLNVLSFIGIVLCSKYLFVHCQWTYPTLLVTVHQFVGAVVMIAASFFSLFPSPEVPFSIPLKLGIPGTLSIFFLNLSLLYNVVSMYQMFKLLTVPMMCVLESMWSGKRYTAPVITSLVLLVGGVGLVTVTEISFTLLGLFYGVTAAVAVAFQQPYTKTLMAEYSLSPAHILYLQCPVNTVFLGLAIPFSDQISTFPSYQFTTLAVVLLVASSLSYVSLGLSQMGIIGQTSAVTFQVVGLSKTELTVLLGILTFRTKVTVQNAAGISIALAGISWYSYLQTLPQHSNAYPLSSQGDKGARKHDAPGGNITPGGSRGYEPIAK